jgi:hypothetical protein
VRGSTIPCVQLHLLTYVRRLGVGGIRPKDLEDGNFTRRTLTSDNKLLTQMIGAKKAKVHLASNQQMTRLGAQPQPKHGRPVAAKKEDSEDEEEGRAATFKSKRRKTVKSKPAPAPEDDSEDQQALPVQARDDGGEIEQAADNGKAEPPAAEEPEEEERPATKPKSIPSRGKAKPKSYLDELLAEKSKKKKRKDSSKTAA